MPPAALLKPALILLLLFQVATPATEVEHYWRAVLPVRDSSTESPRQICVTLDAAVFADAAASLKDLRLSAGPNRIELPYAITRSGPAELEDAPAAVLNRVISGPGRLSFDLRMPTRPYTAVDLHFDRADFVATVTVSGEATPGSPRSRRTLLGSVTLFDLTAQHLFRSTMIPLEESSFPYLHLELQVAPATGAPPIPDTLTLTASVPRDREAQSLYTTVASTSNFTQTGRETHALFRLPVHVPIERIKITLAPTFTASFSRSVTIAVRADPVSHPAPAQAQLAALEVATGTIFRVHALQGGRALAAESLAIPVAIGSNMQRPATLDIAIDNPPGGVLPIASVALQMRQRRLCFDPPADAMLPLTLSYGDPNPPAQDHAQDYTYAARFSPAVNPRDAMLGPEQSISDPAMQPVAGSDEAAAESKAKRRWLEALAVLAIFAVFSLRAVRRRSR